MAAECAAQEEFDSIIQKALVGNEFQNHPYDREDYKNDIEHNDRDEEEEYIQKKVDENMRMPTFDRLGEGTLRLPHSDFDRGRTTGVKGVIADARSYEEARKGSSSWRNKPSRGGSGSRADNRSSTMTFLKDDGEGSTSEDEEFLEKWREQRRMELQRDGSDIRNRRTSPSVRRFGRFDQVDAMGYLDAIERVGRDTVVVVFVYDPEVWAHSHPLLNQLLTSQCAVSQAISDALTPLVPTHPSIHFVRVHYEDIEFDNAGVPAILAYKNQGDLFANLTYIIDQIPEETLFDTRALETILRKHQVL
jgi:hypothetical protein